MYHHLKHLEEDLQAENMLLAITRKQRAPLDIVGNIASSLFGVLDSTYAKDMASTINKVKHNEEHLLTLLKNQTSLIDSTINVIKRDEISNSKRLKLIEDYIADTRNTSNLFDKWSWYTSLSTQLAMMASNLQRVQSEIINILTDVRHNKISPMLISPRQLKEQLEQIRRHLKTGQILPVSPNNILMAYQMMKGEGAIVDDHVIIKVKFPLISSQVLDIYKLTPIPFISQEGIQSIETRAPFLAINSHHDEFVEMSEADFKTCQERAKNDFICYNKQAMFSSETSCEMKLFHNKTDASCKLITTKRAFLWLGTYAKNQWIFATNSCLKLSAVCVDGASDIELQGSGWLTARPGCTIRNTLMTITTREATETKLQASYARFGDIDLTETVTKSSNTTKSIDVRTLNVNELLQRKMELFPKDTFRLPHSLSPIEHHHIAIYVGLIFVMIISIIHFVKKWQVTQQNHRGHTTSATMATLATQPFTVNIDDC
ncbi:hypothetical protein KR059_011927 [Drosophila kikkawai]|nr:hypothetical protein KR059_011927 [Drosophila kikkawai]